MHRRTTGACRASGPARPAPTYIVSFNYQSGGGNVNLTGSPDYAARVRVVGDPGAGCSSIRIGSSTRAAFQGPRSAASVSIRAPATLKGCFISTMDLAIARTIRLGGAQSIQLRIDMFNAFNQAGDHQPERDDAVVSPDRIRSTFRTCRSTRTENLIESRSRPRGAGFGVATAYQAPRTMQFQLRFAF